MVDPRGFVPQSGIVPVLSPSLLGATKRNPVLHGAVYNQSLCSWINREDPLPPALAPLKIYDCGAFWLKSELFLTKIRIANFDAPPRRRSLTLATQQKSFLRFS